MIQNSESHAHTDCRCLEGLLSDYIDGDLETILCKELERHLEDCDNCKVVVDTLKKTISLYHVNPQPDPVPSEVKERLYKRLKIEDLLKE
jgi:anti-sigma factor RsiW